MVKKMKEKTIKQLLDITVDSDWRGDWLKNSKGEIIADARSGYCKECGTITKLPDYWPLICELLNRIKSLANHLPKED